MGGAMGGRCPRTRRCPARGTGTGDERLQLSVLRYRSADDAPRVRRGWVTGPCCALRSVVGCKAADNTKLSAKPVGSTTRARATRNVALQRAHKPSLAPSPCH